MVFGQGLRQPGAPAAGPAATGTRDWPDRGCASAAAGSPRWNAAKMRPRQVGATRPRSRTANNRRSPSCRTTTSAGVSPPYLRAWFIRFSSNCASSTAPQCCCGSPGSLRSVTRRAVSRRRTRRTAPHGAADDLLGGLQIEWQHAPGCLQPGQLRCVGRQVGTLVGLVDDRGGQSPPLLAREPATLVMQRRAGAQDGAQRRAVAVRGRRPQGVAQLLGLHLLLGGGSQTAAIAATSPRASAQPAQRGSQVIGGRSRRTNQHAWQREADC